MADPVTIMAGVAAAASIGSTVVGTMGSLAGEKQDKYAAQNREKMAKIQADQTQAASLDELRRSIGNIKAIRASSGTQVGSPTTAAFLDAERSVSRDNLKKKLTSYELDAQQAKIDESLYQQKSMLTLLGGGFKIGNTLATADW
jgi:hypothetical protein